MGGFRSPVLMLYQEYLSARLDLLRPSPILTDRHQNNDQEIGERHGSQSC